MFRPLARTGFLPPTAPLLHLPGPFQALLDAVPALAPAYQGSGVRAALLDLDAALGYRRDDARQLSAAQQEALLSATAILMHLYRWNAVPVAPARFQERPDFPAHLHALFRDLSAAHHLPPCGTMHTLKYLNWRSDALPPGEPYHAAQVQAGQVRTAHNWHATPAGDDRDLAGQLDLWIQTFVLTEARGQAVLGAAAQALSAAHHHDRSALEDALADLHAAISAMTRQINTLMRFRVVRSDLWRVFIQPTFGWGLPVDGVPDGPVLEGASGLQLGGTQVADLALGVGFDSNLGRALRHSRASMTPPQRALLNAWEPHRNVIRAAVLDWGGSRARDAFDAALNDLNRWRVSHRERGAVYLRGDGREHVMASTGTQLDAGIPHEQAFRDLMNERIRETGARSVGQGGPHD
ncbi:hypothetical protein GCM10008959_07110 [Deinococcus seoulensis]|uniref:Indoleamine 2,3-dioxygenase n=1 Tax=Deinococcus seoulensis TaxID=1837379 RepID=A0ABQ2RR05_9DEIO|nr:hypothetical protein [Deinococcus seoulensis]GGR48575.1 hypothetical protein GCM10008959_07110 [Deinococcus seoulensis]